MRSKMISWIFFGLGMLMMACTLTGYACIHVGSQSEPEEMRYYGM